MAVFKSDRYRKSTTTEPFQLDLAPEGEPEKLVTFKDPNRLPLEDSFAIFDDDNPRRTLETLLGEDFPIFWEEWRHHPVDELGALLEDVKTHFRR
ncbi:hypothetical protein ACFWY9_28600 [Amycolatopsis sp. NPDC059027]|uniref:hypothetical protein n=1 Tax=Amycolatopsis sp. NPDC059027 TaxID=3346709 RepID=UPI00366C1463